METNDNNNPTYEKASIPEIYQAWGKLECKGWNMNNICDSWSEFGTQSLPIVALNNGLKGPALWILAGIHGEEPAGPTMLARNIEYLSNALTDIPTMILPLCNPQGYQLNQRYLYHADSNKEGISVGDAEHVLLNQNNNPRTKYASSNEAESIIHYLLNEHIKRPPVMVIDLHEDALIDRGYIYSQGIYGAEDRAAQKILKEMDKFVEIARNGYTRFDERIVNGLIGFVEDGSIDEFMASKAIYLGGIIPGINAETVLTIETPAKNIDLEYRVNAQQAALYAAVNMMKERR
jgi:hypothetical protein